MDNLITVEVAYATPDVQKIIRLNIMQDSHILQVILKSGITEFFPDLTINAETPIGIFGKRIDINSYKLQDKDRIEIYRQLTKTPNERRLERANIKPL